MLGKLPSVHHPLFRTMYSQAAALGYVSLTGQPIEQHTDIRSYLRKLLQKLSFNFILANNWIILKSSRIFLKEKFNRRNLGNKIPIIPACH